MTVEMGIRPGLYQLFMATEAVISFVDGVLLGTIAAMCTALRLHASLPVAVLAGVAAAIASIAVPTVIGMRMWSGIDHEYPPLYPSASPTSR